MAGEVNILDRMVRAVDKVRERMMRAARALEAASVPYAVAGGNAVAAWVATVDETAVRNTRDVDILLARTDFERACQALAGAGFRHRHSAGLDMFLDGPEASPREALHVVFAAEHVRPDHSDVAPPVSAFRALPPGVRFLELEALVRMKLNGWRDKDRVHLRDLIDVGLLDRSFAARLPEPLAARLAELLDNPDG